MGTNQGKAAHRLSWERLQGRSYSKLGVHNISRDMYIFVNIVSIMVCVTHVSYNKFCPITESKTTALKITYKWNDSCKCFGPAKHKNFISSITAVMLKPPVVLINAIQGTGLQSISALNRPKKRTPQKNSERPFLIGLETKKIQTTRGPDTKLKSIL